MCCFEFLNFSLAGCLGSACLAWRHLTHQAGSKYLQMRNVYCSRPAGPRSSRNLPFKISLWRRESILCGSISEYNFLYVSGYRVSLLCLVCSAWMWREQLAASLYPVQTPLSPYSMSPNWRDTSAHGHDQHQSLICCFLSSAKPGTCSETGVIHLQ